MEPKSMTKEITATIEGWKLIHNFEDKIVITGFVYNDTKNRFAQGMEIVTSDVLDLNLVYNVAITKNSVYKLGETFRVREEKILQERKNKNDKKL